MATTQLKREPNIGVANPDWPDIRSTMSNIVSDGDEQSLTLQHSSAANPSELLIIRVNDDQTGEPVGWLVHYIPSSGRESRVLTNTGELAPELLGNSSVPWSICLSRVWSQRMRSKPLLPTSCNTVIQTRLRPGLTTSRPSTITDAQPTRAQRHAEPDAAPDPRRKAGGGR